MERIYWNLFGREYPAYLVEVEGGMYHIVLESAQNRFTLTDHEFNRFCRYAD